MKIIAYLHIPNDEFRYYHDYEHIHLFNYKFLLIVHFHFYSHKNRHWFLVLRSKFHCCKNRAWNFPVSLLAQLGEFFISNSNNHIILDIFPKFNCLGGPLSNWLYQSLIFFFSFQKSVQHWQQGQSVTLHELCTAFRHCGMQCSSTYCKLLTVCCQHSASELSHFHLCSVDIRRCRWTTKTISWLKSLQKCIHGKKNIGPYFEILWLCNKQ